MAKGIRVNALAKELGVDNKTILQKLKDEGLGASAPNHMSLLPLGLAESVREWFAHTSGGVATAIETAAPVEVATKPKTARKSKKKTAETGEGEGGSTETTAGTAVIDAPPPPVETAPIIERAPVVEEAPPAPIVVLIAPPEAPAAPAVMKTVEPPPTTEKHGAHPTGMPVPVPARPTIRIGDRPTTATPERKAIVPAAQLVTPEPAKIQGPRVVREEKPDVVPAPRPRGPRPPGATDAPAFTQARAVGGRGVKVSDDDEAEAEKKAAAKGKSLSSRRRGPDGRRGEAEEKLREFTEADLIERRDRLNAATAHRTAFDSHLKKRAERGSHIQSKTIVEKGEPVQIKAPITVKSLSAALGIKANEIISALMKQGTFATVNQTLSMEVAEVMALERGIVLQVEREQTLEEVLEKEIEDRGAGESLTIRPPVVTILGHVDHGKTSLLDKIRNANVAAGEAGGITQHTAAWMVQLGEKRVTFIDTPGHQAFTSMRARGANMTDVVVLVVSAAEGVQPQTIESINHAKAAGVPIVVAMNKIDRPDKNEQQVLGQLAGNGLNPVEWGGDTEVIRTSAVTGQGIPELIEILDYQSQLLELKADPKSAARGIVIEANMDEGLGSVATVLVQDGTLRVGDIILSGPGYGRIRSLLNDRGQSIQEATPSMPVIVSGLDTLPNAGDKFYTVDDLDRARSIAEERQVSQRQTQLSSRTQVTLDNIFATMKAGEAQTINLIIKGDMQGSVETLVSTVTGQNTEEVKVRVIHSGVGGITESDVELAMATKAKPTDNKVAIIGFHVVPDDSARAMAEQNHIDVKLYRVIYEIFDDLKKALSGMLAPEEREKLHGHAEVRQVFKVSKVGSIAGCLVTDGHIQRGSKIRLIRDGVVITENIAIESLKRVKDDAREVKSGLECGIKLAGYDDIKVGDVLEAYVREKFERTL